METNFTSEGRKLNVVLHSTSLPSARNDYYGKVQRNSETITLENLISHIQEHETSVRPLTILYCAGLLKTEILRQLATGSAINVLDLCTVYLAVKGGMSGENPSAVDVQSLVVRCTPSPELRAVAKDLSVANVSKAENTARINIIADLFTGNENSSITANRSLRITGTRLRIAGENPANGIYLISVDDPAIRVRVSDTYITRNDPKTLEFFVPDSLATGERYYVELISQFTSGNVFLKDPRSIQSPITLTVA